MTTGKRKPIVLVLFVALALCVAAAALQLATPRHPALHSVGDSPRDYSTDSRLLYYYMLYTEGILSDDFTMSKEGLQGLVTTDPSETLYTEAILYFLSQQQFNEALIFAEQAVKHHPANQTLAVFLAEAYSQTGKTQKAITILEGFYQQGEASDFMVEELIGLYLKTHQTNKANNLLSAIPESKASPATIFFQSKLYTQQGKYAKARNILRSFTERYPDVADAWIELATVEEHLDNIPASINAYKRACQLNPYNEEIWLHLAELQLTTGNVAAAFNTLQQHPNLAEYGFNGAILLSNNGLHDEAKVLIKDSIQQGADPSEGAILTAAVIVHASDNLQEALDILQTVPKDSGYADLATERTAQILTQMGQCEEARTIIAKLHAKSISTIELWGVEIYCYVKEEKYSEALKSVNKALQEFPDNPDLLFSKGSVYDYMEETSSAFQVMEKLLAITPDDPRVLNYVGYTLAEQGKELDRALTLIQAAHKAHPQAEYIIDSLAWVHYQRGEYDLAWEYITQCLALADKDPIIWEHFGDIANKRHDRENALKGYTNALARDAKNKAAIEAKREKLRHEDVENKAQ